MPMAQDLLTKCFSRRRKRENAYDQESIFAEPDEIKSRGVAVDMGALENVIVVQQQRCWITQGRSYAP